MRLERHFVVVAQYFAIVGLNSRTYWLQGLESRPVVHILYPHTSHISILESNLVFKIGHSWHLYCLPVSGRQTLCTGTVRRRTGTPHKDAHNVFRALVLKHLGGQAGSAIRWPQASARHTALQHSAHLTGTRDQVCCTAAR